MNEFKKQRKWKPAEAMLLQFKIIFRCYFLTLLT